MDASCKIQGSIHVFRLVNIMCPGKWVHITYNDIEYHLHFNVSKVYLAYLLRKDQKYTFRTILSFITYSF